MMPRVLLVAALALVLTACSTVDDAGTRVTPTPGSSTGPGSGTTASAPADLVATAELVDCPATDPDVAARDDGMPDLTLDCLGDGPDVRLAGLRGTPTVINLWASWCDPCRDELPLLSDLSASTRGSLLVLGIAVQSDPSASLSLLTDLGVHYASVRDDLRTTQAPLRWTGLPMTVFLDADGVVTFVQRGVITDADQLRTLVLDHLGVEVPA